MRDGVAWNQLRVALSFLNGKKCWDVRGGHAAGSVVSLHFGGRIKRSRETDLQRGPIKLREFEVGECVIFGWGPWELCDADRCIAVSHDENPDETVAALRRTVVGSLVVDHELYEDPPRLVVRFASRVSLDLRAGPEEGREFEYLDPEREFSVSHDGEIEMSARGGY